MRKKYFNACYDIVGASKSFTSLSFNTTTSALYVLLFIDTNRYLLLNAPICQIIQGTAVRTNRMETHVGSVLTSFDLMTG